MNKSLRLIGSKVAKQDEFYTLYEDIAAEIEGYDVEIFKNKIIHLPCDDPSKSNFTKYFIDNFKRLGLKKLISTCYVKNDPNRLEGKFYLFKENKELNRGKIQIVTLDNLDNPPISYLEGDGDFRSAEVTAIKEGADIIITNPPFSLFRAIVDWAADKSFLLVGSVLALNYKNIGLLFMDNKIHLGYSGREGGGKLFLIPDHYSITTDNSFTEIGDKRYLEVSGIRWFTNLVHNIIPPFLELRTMAENLELYPDLVNQKAYELYDNYDAIEVPKSNVVPSDWDGIMGVPITFMDKFNPNQFELIGMSQIGCHDQFSHTKTYEDYNQVVKKTGITSKGGLGSNNPVLTGEGWGKSYYTNGDRKVFSLFHRLFIKRR